MLESSRTRHSLDIFAAPSSSVALVQFAVSWPQSRSRTLGLRAAPPTSLAARAVHLAFLSSRASILPQRASALRHSGIGLREAIS